MVKSIISMHSEVTAHRLRTILSYEVSISELIPVMLIINSKHEVVDMPCCVVAEDRSLDFLLHVESCKHKDTDSLQLHK